MARRIAIYDADSHGFPNLALLKLVAWHRAQGDCVERYMSLFAYDVVYASKVFSWTQEKEDLPRNTIRGGTGYDIGKTLPDAVEHTCPAYDFANMDYSLGFLTRGCIRACPWCIVPEKEGELRAHADIDEFCRHKNVVLMDNNVLAHDHGIAQIEKMARMGLRVDFNQGLDARLIDSGMARRLAALKWLKPLRLACDYKGQMPAVAKAVTLLRAAGARPKDYSCYVLVKDIPDALERVEFLRSLGVSPFAQPYRDFSGNNEPAEELKRFARWVNLKKCFKTTSWAGYNEQFRHTEKRQLLLCG